MKKVLSVAMASAMVLGMGANAFAITYNSGSNDTASWPKGFAFEGSLFVTNKDGDIIKEATTDINSNKAVDFEPGDVIWMPLYADNQKVYTVDGAVENGQDEVAATTITLNVAEQGQAKVGEVEVDKNGTVLPFSYTDELNKVVYYYNMVKPGNKDGWRYVELKSGDFTTYANGRQASGVDLYEKVEAHTVKEEVSVKVAPTLSEDPSDFTAGTTTISFSSNVGSLSTSGMNMNGSTGNYSLDVKLSADNASKVLKDTDNDSKATRYLANEQTVTLKFGEDNDRISDNVTITGSKETDVPAGTELKDVTIKVRLPKVAAVDKNAGTIKPGYTNNVNVTETVVSHGHYTGNIDKNWSINLIEKSTGVAELIEKAELYKATAVDYTSYHKYTDEIAPNAVYLKITLEDEWKTTSSETLKYYVYVANNKSNTQKTNEVWVSGKYANTDVRPVSFDWTNDASKAGLWKVKEGNGIAVFDFADKAFFSVKMYEGETMYLDLKTAYDKAIAGEMDAEADSFYKFDNTNANFARTGELLIVSDDSSLVPYQIDEDGNFVAVDAEYVENYAVAHTNKKVNGFVFNTKQLGNYVLSTEELGEEEEVTEEPEVEEPAVEEPVVEEPVVEEETNKPNPNTGAEDFVGLAVSLAVVSVAAAGALALKK